MPHGANFKRKPSFSSERTERIKVGMTGIPTTTGAPMTAPNSLALQHAHVHNPKMRRTIDNEFSNPAGPGNFPNIPGSNILGS